MRRAPLILASGLLIATSAGCSHVAHMVSAHQIQGDGHVKEETRPVAPFTAVEIHNAFEAEIRAGGEPSLMISADANVLPVIESEVRDGRLIVRTRPGASITTNAPMKLTITAPKIEAIDASGSCLVKAEVGPTGSFLVDLSGASRAEISGLDTGKLTADISGSGILTASGRAQELVIDASGASQVLAADLEVNSARVDLSGASRGQVRPAVAVSGDVSGASSLEVIGQPQSRDVDASGAGSVRYQTAPATAEAEPQPQA